MSGIGEFINVLGFIWERRQALLVLLEKIPDAMRITGAGMEAAGQGAIQAGRALKGGNGTQPDALDALEATAAALTQCYQQIELVAGHIKDAGNDIGSVKVPTVEPTYAMVAGFKVVNGLEATDKALFGNIATALKDGADELEEVSDSLHDAATQLRRLKQAIEGAGGNLNTVGAKLKDGGQALKAV
jgi:hypothetical protein